MITRRKFMGSTVALGGAAFLPRILTSPPGKKCERPSTVECYWAGSPSCEKVDVILYADSREKEIGGRYIIKGMYSPKEKGKEVRWWLPLDDVRRMLKDGIGRSVLGVSSPWEQDKKVPVKLEVLYGRFVIYGLPGSKEYYLVPAEDVQKLIQATEAV